MNRSIKLAGFEPWDFDLDMNNCQPNARSPYCLFVTAKDLPLPHMILTKVII